MTESNALVSHTTADIPVYPLIEIRTKFATVTVALDTMSGSSYITTRLVEQLDLQIKKREHSLHVKGLGGKETQVITYTADFEIENTKYRLNIIDNICMALPEVGNEILDSWPWLRTQKLSCKFPRSYVSPQILIGLDLMSTILIPAPNLPAPNLRTSHSNDVTELRTFLHRSGLAALNTKFELVVYGNLEKRAIISTVD